MTALNELSAAEAAERIRSGTLDRVEYFDYLSGGVEAFNRDLNAYLRFDGDAIRAAAQASAPGGPLGGVPVAVKDNIVTRNEQTTCASRILEGFRSPVDATAVRRLLDAGAYAAGKTNLDEFAMGSSTEHSAFGVTRNPWDLSRVAGGSSGGSAAAVAARLVPVALGSETGGSVRQPAAFCGVLGLKPTYGRVSRSGLVAFASSLDQIGIFARSAADCAVMLGVIAGFDASDSTSSPDPVSDYSCGLAVGVAGLRLGIVAEAVDPLAGELRANFDQAVDLLRRGGATIEIVSVPTITYSVAVYSIVANAEASANLARFDGVRYGKRSGNATDVRSMYLNSRSEGFGAEVKRRIMLGTYALSAGYYDEYYGRAQRVRARMRRDFSGQFQHVDALLTPTTPGPAFRIGEKLADPLSMYLSDIYTAPANLVGIPAIAIPSGFSDEGLPLSLQAMGPDFSEAVLLRIAHFLEQETGYARRVPPGFVR